MPAHLGNPAGALARMERDTQAQASTRPLLAARALLCHAPPCPLPKQFCLKWGPETMHAGHVVYVAQQETKKKEKKRKEKARGAMNGLGSPSRLAMVGAQQHPCAGSRPANRPGCLFELSLELSSLLQAAAACPANPPPTHRCSVSRFRDPQAAPPGVQCRAVQGGFVQAALPSGG
jgi:hypothetical protein